MVLGVTGIHSHQIVVFPSRHKAVVFVVVVVVVVVAISPADVKHGCGTPKMENPALGFWISDWLRLGTSCGSPKWGLFGF